MCAFIPNLKDRVFPLEVHKCRHTVTSCGRIRATLYLEDDTLDLSFSLDDTLATVCDEETNNFIDDEGWDNEP